MFVYRATEHFGNSGFGLFSSGDGGYESTNEKKLIDKVKPEEFAILTIVSHYNWLCENDLIYRLRVNDKFFLNISNARINEILLDLTKKEYLLREFVQTDSEEDIIVKKDDNDDDKPRAVMMISQ